MSAMSSKTTQVATDLPPGIEASEELYQRVYVWQLPIRIFHWTNAGAISVLFATGLMISDPALTSGGEAWEVMTVATIRKIHYIAAFVFLIGFLWRVYWFYFGNVYARSGMPRPWRPSWWKGLFTQSMDYIKLRGGTPHLGHNSLAGLSYTIFVICLGWLQILTGFAMYSENSPDGFWASLCGWVLPLMGGSAQVHAWHHLFAWSFLFFVILHVYIVFLDAREYRNGLIVSMITGFKFRRIRKKRLHSGSDAAGPLDEDPDTHQGEHRDEDQA